MISYNLIYVCIHHAYMKYTGCIDCSVEGRIESENRLICMKFVVAVVSAVTDLGESFASRACPSLVMRAMLLSAGGAIIPTFMFTAQHVLVDCLSFVGSSGKNTSLLLLYCQDWHTAVNTFILLGQDSLQSSVGCSPCLCNVVIPCIYIYIYIYIHPCDT